MVDILVLLNFTDLIRLNIHVWSDFMLLIETILLASRVTRLVFLKTSWDKFHYKSWPNLWSLFGYLFWKTSLFKLHCFGYCLAKFGKKLGHFFQHQVTRLARWQHPVIESCYKSKNLCTLTVYKIAISFYSISIIWYGWQFLIF